MFSSNFNIVTRLRKCVALLSLPLSLVYLISLSYADDTKLHILTTIAPIHSLATSLFGDHAEVMILSKGGSSPHGRSLKPSDLKKIKEADLIVQVGPVLESTLQKTLTSNKDKEHILTLMELPTMTLHELRKGGVWGEGHQHHDDHDDEHAGHDEHADHDDHADHDEHAHEEAGHDDHADERHHEDDHAFDPHFWLDLNNAKEIVKAMSKAASEFDPSLKTELAANERALLQELDKLDTEVRSEVSHVSNVSYLVFHDAYQYFEKAYSLKPAGAVLLDPERQLGAKRLSELKKFVDENEVKCVFSEPQFDARVLNVLREDTNLKLAQLDPIGLGLESGAGLYSTLLRNLGHSLHECLSD